MQMHTIHEKIIKAKKSHNGDSKMNKKLTISNSIYKSYQANLVGSICLLIK